MKGEPISVAEFKQGNPVRLDQESPHYVRVFGMPLFRAVPYTRDIFRLGGEGGDPLTWLKVRSFALPGLLTNGSKVERMCGGFESPCWRPRGRPGPGQPTNLEIVRAGDQLRYRVLASSGTAIQRLPGQEELPSAEQFDEAFRLNVGVTSTWGVAYWLAAAALFVILASRAHANYGGVFREQARRVPGAKGA